MTNRGTITRRQALASGAGALGATFLPGNALTQARPVKIGVILYLTGVQAFMGHQTLKCNDFGSKIVRESGGPPIEFVYGDA